VTSNGPAPEPALSIAVTDNEQTRSSPMPIRIASRHRLPPEIAALVSGVSRSYFPLFRPNFGGFFKSHRG